jgi:hypothetical protein
MSALSYGMKPQDILILLKIASLGDELWNQTMIADSLDMSQSEISQSIARSKYSGLIDSTGKKIMSRTVLDFLKFGLSVVYPVKPGMIVRGIPTAHSASPLKELILSNELYVWPHPFGESRGQAINPLYPTVPNACIKDEKLYELLSLTESLRVGRTRERNLAMDYLERTLC